MTNFFFLVVEMFAKKTKQNIMNWPFCSGVESKRVMNFFAGFFFLLFSMVVPEKKWNKMKLDLFWRCRVLCMYVIGFHCWKKNSRRSSSSSSSIIIMFVDMSKKQRKKIDEIPSKKFFSFFLVQNILEFNIYQKDSLG